MYVLNTMKKKFFSFFLVQWIVAIFISLIIWLIYLLCFVKYEGRDILKKYRKRSAIFVFWHGRSMMLSPMVRINGLTGFAVSSLSRDGQIMAKIQRIFGLKTIYGSSSEGGISVLKEGVRILRNKANNILCITPDGPSGPSLKVKDGALYFAKMTGLPIIPVCYSASRVFIQNRWDRYFIVRPFSKVICQIGDPIFIDKKITKKEFENKKQYLENIMINQLRSLDSRFNLFKVEQGQTSTIFKKNKK